jgi:hypothetical protein
MIINLFPFQIHSFPITLFHTPPPAPETPMELIDFCAPSRPFHRYFLFDAAACPSAISPDFCLPTNSPCFAPFQSSTQL